jgi:spore coat protein CotH
MSEIRAKVGLIMRKTLYSSFFIDAIQHKLFLKFFQSSTKGRYYRKMNERACFMFGQIVEDVVQH